jgi:hypothetical protein
MKKIFTLFCLLSSTILLHSQTITIQPYLQDAEPSSIFILWETDMNEESIVEYGLTEALGNTVSGIAYASNGVNRIHEVQLENLDRFTRYYYQVKTGAASSEIVHFKTPPFASDNEPFRLLAMSDMQRDNSQPGKFQEIVEEGVITYLAEQVGGDLSDNLALVMIPGDLVTTGNNFLEWKNTFFNPGEQLFSQVPVYPVLGNHEANTNFYFAYFKLPENGTAGFEEHWWYKDYGNTRIIGLNSNNPFATGNQLNWLEDALAETCQADSIDFVFAELHHPHKSELWTPGESPFTGEVIQRLEQFTTDCGKPSIHFFGHTHGYSRGQSRDHKHLWINVATAGGAIDNWGEFPNFDYNEFSKSQDEYGFLLVEVTDGADPTLTIKRIGRGDQDVIENNILRDSLVLRVEADMVAKPTPVFPVNLEVIPECVTLEANEFSSDNNSMTHGQSHWQVSTDPNDFSQLSAESWKNFENWYYEIDTQAGDDLTDEKIQGLAENTAYWWRVRYRDRELNWSEWSEVAPFTTGESISTDNLLLNPGAEDSLQNWTVVEGVVEALTAGICDGIDTHSGTRYFAVGGLCDHSEIGRCIQGVEVLTFADSIDTGNYMVNYGGYLSNFNGNDIPEMRLLFLDENAVEIATSDYLSSLNSSWTILNEWLTIPPLTRVIQMELKGTRTSGIDNDSYFDDLFLTLGPAMLDCSGVSAIEMPNRLSIPLFKVNPNPVDSQGVIGLPGGGGENVKLQVVDATGTKVNLQVNYEQERITFNKQGLAPGAYFFTLRGRRSIVGRGEFLVVE